MNPFVAYVKERMNSGSLTGRASTRIKTLSEEWKTLSEDEKAPYLEKAAAERERYSREVLEVLGRPIYKQ